MSPKPNPKDVIHVRLAIDCTATKPTLESWSGPKNTQLDIQYRCITAPPKPEGGRPVVKDGSTTKSRVHQRHSDENIGRPRLSRRTSGDSQRDQTHEWLHGRSIAGRIMAYRNTETHVQARVREPENDASQDELRNLLDSLLGEDWEGMEGTEGTRDRTQHDEATALDPATQFRYLGGLQDDSAVSQSRLLESSNNSRLCMLILVPITIVLCFWLGFMYGKARPSKSAGANCGGPTKHCPCRDGPFVGCKCDDIAPCHPDEQISSMAIVVEPPADVPTADEAVNDNPVPAEAISVQSNHEQEPLMTGALAPSIDDNAGLTDGDSQSDEDVLTNHDGEDTASESSTSSSTAADNVAIVGVDNIPASRLTPPGSVGSGSSFDMLSSHGSDTSFEELGMSP